jgi:hypothetical protein
MTHARTWLQRLVRMLPGALGRRYSAERTLSEIKGEACARFGRHYSHPVWSYPVRQLYAKKLEIFAAFFVWRPKRRASDLLI